MSDVPVAPAIDPARDIEIDPGDSGGDSPPLAHQDIPNILGIPDILAPGGSERRVPFFPADFLSHTRSLDGGFPEFEESFPALRSSSSTRRDSAGCCILTAPSCTACASTTSRNRALTSRSRVLSSAAAASRRALGFAARQVGDLQGEHAAGHVHADVVLGPVALCSRRGESYPSLGRST